MFTYTVKSGDSLSLIAARYGTTWQAIVNQNAARYPSLRTNPNAVNVGWQLEIPTSGGTSTGGTLGNSVTVAFETSSRLPLISDTSWDVTKTAQLQARLSAYAYTVVVNAGTGSANVPVKVIATTDKTPTAFAAIVNNQASQLASINQLSFFINGQRAGTTTGGGGPTTGGVTPLPTPQQGETTVYIDVNLSLVAGLLTSPVLGLLVIPLGIFNYLVNSGSAEGFKRSLAARGYKDIEIRVESSATIPTRMFVVMTSVFTKSEFDVRNDVRQAALQNSYVAIGNDNYTVRVVPKGTSLQDVTGKRPGTEDNAIDKFFANFGLSAPIGIAIGVVLFITLVKR